MDWNEFIFWVIFTVFMSVVFPFILVGAIFCLINFQKHRITTVPSTPYVIDQTSRQTQPSNIGFGVISYPNNDNRINDGNSTFVQPRDIPPPYASVPGNQFPTIQTQLPYPEQDVGHFPIPSSGRRVRFSIDEGLDKPTIYDIGPTTTTVQPNIPPSEPSAYQLSVHATYQNELNNQTQNHATFQAQVPIPNSIPLQNLNRPTTLALPPSLSTVPSEQSTQNQFIPIPSPFTSNEPTRFPPIPSSSSNQTVNSTQHDDPPPSYHKIDKL